MRGEISDLNFYYINEILQWIVSIEQSELVDLNTMYLIIGTTFHL